MLTESMRSFYENYYDEKVVQKRKIAATDSINQIIKIVNGRSFDTLLDVGSGEGAVLQEIADSKLSKEIYAIEISQSGIDAIKKRQIDRLVEVQLFDGYEIPYPDKSFDLAIATYVLEHVDHQRMFIREMMRVAKQIIISVPLEHTLWVNKARETGKSIGHVNFYTLETFQALLETSGLEVEKTNVYLPSLDYEKLLSDKKGPLKHIVKSSSLSIAPKLTRNIFTCYAIALCKGIEF